MKATKLVKHLLQQVLSYNFISEQIWSADFSALCLINEIKKGLHVDKRAECGKRFLYSAFSATISEKEVDQRLCIYYQNHRR